MFIFITGSTLLFRTSQQRRGCRANIDTSESSNIRDLDRLQFARILQVILNCKYRKDDMKVVKERKEGLMKMDACSASNMGGPSMNRVLAPESHMHPKASKVIFFYFHELFWKDKNLELDLLVCVIEEVNQA